jgi:serine O-acetyltransferase
VWDALYREVEQQVAGEPLLAQFARPAVLDHPDFEHSLAALLSQKLECPILPRERFNRMALDAYQDEARVSQAARKDLLAVCDRDPACNRFSEPFLYYKGFQGLQVYRIAHWLWWHDRRDLAIYLQSRMSEIFAMDIHPAARIGHGILIDHAHSIVIGETAVVGNNVSMLHEVTLGGTGKQAGDRHPKIASGVLIGAGAKILGNVRVGEGAKIGAGSVVLDDVSPHCTVAGVPARPVGNCSSQQPALDMDHTLEQESSRPRGAN